VGDNRRVTLNLDTSTPIRSLARYRELVTAVFEAPVSAQETVAMEWKREANVGDKPWQAELSRQVLGFANRDPDVAAIWFGGCAYILVGVSPGILNGTPVHDAAKIEGWLLAYVGLAPNAPEWAPAYVEVNGKRVLVLSIEPPRWGHPMWTCRKTYLPDPRRTTDDPKVVVREGAVYVRHKASTEEANSTDIEMLSRRLVGTRRRVTGISLLLAASSRACPIDATEETVTEWADQEREALKPPPPAPPTKLSVSELANSSLLTTAKLMADLGNQFWEPDPRTPEAYQAEVDAYIENATKAMPAVLVKRAYERKLGRIALSVRNETDDPIRQLQVELFIGGEGIWAASEYMDVPEISLPKRPVMLGKAGRNRFGGLGGIALSGLRVPSYSPYFSPAVRAIGRGVTINNGGSSRLTFAALDLYPQETMPLDVFYLFANAGAFAGKTLTAEWTARARDVSGVHRATLEIAVDARVPTIDELLADAEEAEGDEDEAT
jgi:hypothetical protein